MEDLNSTTRTHKLTMINRKNSTLTGVNDVLSFDIHEILLETEQGMLMIKGDDLHVSRLTLDKGEVDVEGKIDSFTYSDVSNVAKKGESLLNKLFG
ncbi:MAG: sporulation protein YabP [Lachnospiraceae bacterium]|nr:sporulation protein YabP [Lachnospiraceae bacterium]